MRRACGAPESRGENQDVPFYNLVLTTCGACTAGLKPTVKGRQEHLLYESPARRVKVRNGRVGETEPFRFGATPVPQISLLMPFCIAVRSHLEQALRSLEQDTQQGVFGSAGNGLERKKNPAT